MVSGKPPRRSKSSNETVTIDLQAEETQLMRPICLRDGEPERNVRRTRRCWRPTGRRQRLTQRRGRAATDTIEADDAKSGSLPLETPRRPKGHPRWQPLRLPASLVASSPSPLPAACNMPAITRPVSHFGALHRDQTAELAALRSELKVFARPFRRARTQSRSRSGWRLLKARQASGTGRRYHRDRPGAGTTDRFAEHARDPSASGKRRQPDFQSSRPASTVASPKSRKSLKNRGMTSRWPARSPSPD